MFNHRQLAILLMAGLVLLALFFAYNTGTDGIALKPGAAEVDQKAASAPLSRAQNESSLSSELVARRTNSLNELKRKRAHYFTLKQDSVDRDNLHRLRVELAFESASSLGKV